MCEGVEEYIDRKALEKQIEMIKNLMESMKWTVEQAMTSMQISGKDKGILLKRL